MHELSIAQTIIEIVQQEQGKHHLRTIKEVGIRIGVFSGVYPDALQFGFEALTDGTALEGCQFKVEIVPLKANCNDCQKKFESDDFTFLCPHCQSGDVEILAGNELDIAYIEGEEVEDEKCV